MARVYIGVGSNIDPERNVPEAVRRLARAVCITGVSTFYHTAEEDRPEQPPFINGVLEIETDLSPSELKYDVLRRIEEELGRIRGANKYAPRAIDLDILLYDDLVVKNEEVEIPDPRIADRAFLALPLSELAPELILPDSERRIGEIARHFDRGSMQPLRELTERVREMIPHESHQGTTTHP